MQIVLLLPKEKHEKVFGFEHSISFPSKLLITVRIVDETDCSTAGETTESARCCAQKGAEAQTLGRKKCKLKK